MVSNFISLILRVFKSGLLTCFLLCILYYIAEGILYPGFSRFLGIIKEYTNNNLIIIIFLILSVFLIGVVIKLLSKARNSYLMKKIPKNLLDNPEVIWEKNPGDFGRGILVGENKNLSTVAIIYAGLALSITCKLEDKASEKIKKTGRPGKDLIFETIIFGPRKNGKK